MLRSADPENATPASDATATGAEGERTLVARLRAGEDAAYEELVRSYGGRLLAVARRFLRVEEDARDAVQDAFISAFRAIDRFEGDSRISTWLHRIVVNASLMKLRSRQRKPETSIEELLPRFLDDGHFADPPTEWQQTAERALQRRQTRERVREAIDRLPDSYRTVLLLRDIEGLDTAEAAEVLQVSANAVKIRLHRARQALRKLIDAHMREDLE
ncbi:MAG: sigma-70 family RNA polymerase sigma factor [Deltaproteobacteria bacterium]|nr:sigma-70 family RNA polymerase sigma factor [Deltaproteobacteria bacterium]